MKKVLYIALCLALALSAMGGAFAEGAALAPGVTVVADENSPTGYTATFVYENADAQSVGLTGTFLFCKPGETTARCRKIPILPSNGSRACSAPA